MKISSFLCFMFIIVAPLLQQIKLTWGLLESKADLDFFKCTWGNKHNRQHCSRNRKGSSCFMLQGRPTQIYVGSFLGTDPKRTLDVTIPSSAMLKFHCLFPGHNLQPQIRSLIWTEAGCKAGCHNSVLSTANHSLNGNDPPKVSI